LAGLLGILFQMRGPLRLQHTKAGKLVSCRFCAVRISSAPPAFVRIRRATTAGARQRSDAPGQRFYDPCVNPPTNTLADAHLPRSHAVVLSITYCQERTEKEVALSMPSHQFRKVQGYPERWDSVFLPEEVRVCAPSRLALIRGRSSSARKNNCGSNTVG